MELPNGISTEINQFGMPLSQGDRVTLALARGLIARPRILLLDEALANFDKATQVAFFRNYIIGFNVWELFRLLSE